MCLRLRFIGLVQGRLGKAGGFGNLAYVGVDARLSMTSSLPRLLLVRYSLSCFLMLSSACADLFARLLEWLPGCHSKGED